MSQVSKKKKKKKKKLSIVLSSHSIVSLEMLDVSNVTETELDHLIDPKSLASLHVKSAKRHGRQSKPDEDSSPRYG